MSLLSEALSCELAHTTGVIDGLLGLYNIPSELSIVEVDALMTDIEKITARLRQLSRLLVFKAQKDHNMMMKAEIARDKRKLGLEEAKGVLERERERQREYNHADWPHPPHP
ncbi:TPA: hypothetical protein ACH3X3_003504 [Trebouxia sp. C0006]